MYSIGITTYGARIYKYLIPLVDQIKLIKPEIEIIITANGEINHFDEEYRKELFEFISTKKNTHLVTYPRFRSLSKLWNTCLINSSNSEVLLLNDDITISREFFDAFDYVEKKGCFKINGSWSHSFLDRELVAKIGWFDERYLGIGEEDGDFEWRWENQFGTTISSRYFDGIINHVDCNDCLADMNKVNGKYSKFNLEFAIGTKYIESEDGKNFGIMDRQLKCISPTPNQYGCEEFYWENKCRL